MSFSRIKDQDKALGILKSSLAQGRLAGGYLFAGPEGVGKKMTAIELAKFINCEKVNDGGSCDICPSCKKMGELKHPDLHIIDSAEADIKIEDIRQLQKEMSLRPFEAKVKVFIIDNAHNLNAASSNALLKILEEPPKNSLMVLITDKPSLLFKTILSRCRVLRFSSIKREALCGVLSREHGQDSLHAHFLAYFSEGRFGRALELKDLDILKDKNAIIDKFSSARRPDLENIQVKEKEDMRWYLNILASWFRDIYLFKAGAHLSEMINCDRNDELPAMAGRYTFADLDGIFNNISDSLRYLDRNINTKLLLYNLGAQLWKE